MKYLERVLKLNEEKGFVVGSKVREHAFDIIIPVNT